MRIALRRYRSALLRSLITLIIWELPSGKREASLHHRDNRGIMVVERGELWGEVVNSTPFLTRGSAAHARRNVHRALHPYD